MAGWHWLSFGRRSPLTRAGSLLQPSLDPLPPYILTEAQLRSQRYWHLLYWENPGRSPCGRQHLRADSHCVASPRVWVLQELQEYLIEDSDNEVQTVES